MADIQILYTGPTVTRDDAIAVGLKRFFTGRPCKRGHVAERRVLSWGCIICHRGWRAENPEWTIRNPEREKENHAKYYAANRESELARSAKYRADNLAKVRERNTKYRSENLDRIKERDARWRAENPDKNAAKERNRRARKRNAEGLHTAADVAVIRKAQNDKCALCRSKLSGGGHVDHIMPLAKGGSNWPRNLQLLCVPCNGKKKDKHPIDFAQQCGFLV